MVCPLHHLRDLSFPPFTAAAALPIDLYFYKVAVVGAATVRFGNEHIIVLPFDPHKSKSARRSHKHAHIDLFLRQTVPAALICHDLPLGAQFI